MKEVVFANKIHDAVEKEFDLSELQRDWNFVATASAMIRVRRAIRFATRVRRPPDKMLLKDLIGSNSCWVLYFIYVPNGILAPHHEFTLKRLKDSGFAILVVCAARDHSSVPAELYKLSDGLYWKGLAGYDFSAYAIGLHALSKSKPGVNVCVMNDSVFGPFSELNAYVNSPKWQIAGFTASALGENHIQSYGFIVRELDSSALQAMGHVFSGKYAFQRPGDVILCQELLFARLSARKLSVGAAWFNDGRRFNDPMLSRPLALLKNGFPFIKRSLLGKFSTLQDIETMKDTLRDLHHPV